MAVNFSHIVKYPAAGNGLAAASNLKAGDVIIRIDKPYLAIVENVALEQVCSYCLYDKTPLKRCTGCKTLHYCSAKCQTLSWKASHKVECGIYKKLPTTPPTPLRALMDLIIRKEIGETSNPPWAGLEGHAVSLQKQKRWDEIVLQAKAAVQLTDSPVSYIEIATNVLCRMATNAFRVTLADNSPVGLCFEPTISLANHSCTPNATVMFDGRRMELRALNNISKDEQIFISYIDPTQPLQIRQKELQTRYFFTCACEKCSLDDSPYATYLKATPVPFPQLELFHPASALKNFATSHGTPPSSLALTNSFPTPQHQNNATSLHNQSKSTNSPTHRLTLLKSALAKLPPSHPAMPPAPAILHDIYLSHLDLGHYVPALLLLLYIYLNCDVYLYPQGHHPIRVIRLFTIARLLKQIASLQNTPDNNPKELMAGVPPAIEKEVKAALSDIDLVSAVHVLLLLVQALSAGSHGRESAFWREVEMEAEEVEGVQGMRGVVGERLSGWIRDGDVEGAEYARRVLQGLRDMSGFGGRVVGW